MAKLSTAPAVTVYYSPCARQVAGRGIRERWWCDYSDYNANLVMAEQSLNDLLVAEFKEAFDQFDKVGGEYYATVIVGCEIVGWEWDHLQQGAAGGHEVLGTEPH